MTAPSTTTRRLAEKPHTYDAFFSYSHAADGSLAPSLQRGVQSFATPWYRRRALRVFRDETNLTATPELWGTIEGALESSRYFVLLASPNAAASRWVNKEVSWWREHRGPATLLIVVTTGNLVWDEAKKDFDWSSTDALPECLADFFDEEPLWVDLRWTHDAEDLSSRNLRLRDPIADLAAPLRGQPKDELLGEDIRQHRRTIRLATGAVVALAILLIAAVAAAITALNQRNTAREQARIAQSRQLAGSASELLSNQPDLALTLAIRAVETEPTEAADTILRQATLAAPAVKLLRGSDDAKVAAFSADGRRLATGHANDRIRIWQPESGRLLRVIGASHPGREIKTLEFSPDGRLLMAANDYGGTLRLYATATGKRMGFPGREAGAAPPDAYLGAAFSPDGSRIATASTDRIGTASDESGLTVWDARTGAQGLQVRSPDKGASLSEPVFSPDGRLLAAVATGFARGAYMWDVRTGRPVGELAPKNLDIVWSIVFGSNGRVAVAFNRAVVVADAPGGGHRVEIPLRVGCPCTMGFGAEDRRLALTSSSDDLEVFDTRTGKRTGVLRRETPLSGHPFDRTGARVVSTRDGGPARVIALAGTRPARVLPGGQWLTWSVAFSPDGTLVASTGQNNTTDPSALRVWNAKTGRELRVIRPLPGKGVSTGIQDAAFGPGGDLVAATADGDTLLIFESASGRQLAIVQDDPDELDQVAFRRSGRMVATAGLLSGVRLWHVGDASGGRVRVEPAGRLRRTSPAEDVAFSPDGRRVAAVVLGVVRIYDVRRRLVAKLAIPGTVLSTAAFSPDGRRVVTAASDQSVRVWDIESQQQELTLRGHDGIVETAEFSPDGNWILTAGASDGTVRVWDANAGGESIAIERGTSSAATFSPDGKRVLVGGSDVRLIDCQICAPLDEVLAVAKRRSTRTLTSRERATFLP